MYLVTKMFICCNCNKEYPEDFKTFYGFRGAICVKCKWEIAMVPEYIRQYFPQMAELVKEQESYIEKQENDYERFL